ncbi:unnamed protein product [Dibothriocephalus latus]|uniref:Protein kinase domain-containing protein n=1 Tax=Dibothriocephalus latus TaxID=60516 RepID=A0A3P6UB70_DIBLA|nr:unnamed protein product [Dibothriocephalus latus]
MNDYATVYLASAPDGKGRALTELKMNDVEGLTGTSMREIAILRGLNHKNIVTLLDVPKTKASSTLVFEYEDMRTIINEDLGIRTDKVRDFFKQVLCGLEFCHQNNITHCDLKPENILKRNDDVIKIGGFDLNRQMTNQSDNPTSEDNTLWYKPPEILLGETKYDGKVDIWSAGCILFEMIVQKPLFPGNDTDSEICYIFNRLGLPPPDYWPELSSNSILQRLYLTDINDREEVELTKEEYANSHLLDKLNKLSEEKSTYSGFQLAFPLMVKCLQPNQSVRIDATQALDDEYFGSVKCPKGLQDITTLNFVVDDSDMGYSVSDCCKYFPKCTDRAH